MFHGLAWRKFPLHREQPGNQLQGALGIRHLPTAGHKGIHSLSRQAEQAGEVGLPAVLFQVWAQQSPQRIPKRGFPTRAKGASAPAVFGATAKGDAEGLDRLPGHFFGSGDQHFGQRREQIEPRGILTIGHVTY